MSFINILDEWPSPGNELVHALMNVFRGGAGQVVQNLDNDANINDSDREQLIESFLRENTFDFEALKNNFENFCRNGRKFKGAIAETARLVTLGHVVDKQNFRDWIENPEASTSPALLGDQAATPESLDLMISMALDIQKAFFKNIRLRQYQMWSFYDAQYGRDPFNSVGTAANELCRRLGLNHLFGKSILYFGHILPADITPYSPTTFDAETNDQFRPGGRTFPTTGEPSEGLPETVHAPNTGANLVLKISQAV